MINAKLEEAKEQFSVLKEKWSRLSKAIRTAMIVFTSMFAIILFICFTKIILTIFFTVWVIAAVSFLIWMIYEGLDD